MTLLASLFLGGSRWLMPVALGGGVLLLALAWSYRTAPRGIRVACFFLKALGLFALSLCLLEPMWTGQRARPGANIYAVIADNSQGMNIRDPGSDRSRGVVMKEWLDPGKAPWQARLETDFEVRCTEQTK